MPSVEICDVGPRDGLQNHPVLLAPAARAVLCDRLAAAGLSRIEAASFVQPKLVPAMAGAAEVLAAVRRSDSIIYAALVLNRRGLDDALAAGADAIHVTYALSDTFGRRNQNRTVEEGAAAAAAIIALARAAGRPARAILSVAFGCPFEGPVAPGHVIDHVGRMAAAGADAVVLGDTIGIGVPTQVRDLVSAALAVSSGPVGLHLHNTRNTGYANAVAGFEAGASIFDASVGGLGGCPFAPNATGNIATEDLVYLFERMGIATGIDLDALIATATWLGRELGERLPGLVHRVDPPAGG